MKAVKLIYNGVIRSKKNSKQIITNPRTGKPMIISGKKERQMENEMVLSFIDQKYEQGWNNRTEDIVVGATYQVSISIWQKNKRRHDLDNQVTSILDALVQACVIPDDSVKYVVALAARNMGVDKANPRAEIDVVEL